MGNEQASEPDFSVLGRPREIYRRFDAKETRQLRRFVQLARQLGRMPVLESIPDRVQLKFPAPPESPSAAVDNDAMFAAAAVFRQLFKDGEPVSFDKVFALLDRSVREHGGPLTAAASAALQTHRETRSEIPNAVGIVHQFSTPTGPKVFSPDELVRTFLYGEYLHSDDAKIRAIAALDATPLARWAFFHAVLLGAQIFWAGANVVEVVLAQPDLTTPPGD